MIVIRLILVASLVLGAYAMKAQSADTVERLVDEWLVDNKVSATASVRQNILSEIEESLAIVLKAEPMASAFENADLSKALQHYLDNQLTDIESPSLEALLREEISPGGQPFSYANRYPKLTVSASFAISALDVNGESVGFIPADKDVTILLDTGSNDVKTVGGSPNNCRYVFNAENGKRYSQTCYVGK